MIAKIHKTENEFILAVCDQNLMGKKIEFKDVTIHISDFYDGEEYQDVELLSLLKEATIVNAMGKETIDFLLEHKIVCEDNIMLLNDVPHVQIFKMN